MEICRVSCKAVLRSSLFSSHTDVARLREHALTVGEQCRLVHSIVVHDRLRSLSQIVPITNQVPKASIHALPLAHPRLLSGTPDVPIIEPNPRYSLYKSLGLLLSRGPGLKGLTLPLLLPALRTSSFSTQRPACLSQDLLCVS